MKYGCSRKMNRPTIIVETNDLEKTLSTQLQLFIWIPSPRKVDGGV